VTNLVRRVSLVLILAIGAVVKQPAIGTSRIVFTTDRVGDRDGRSANLVNVFAVDEDGRQGALISASPGQYSSPSWSPDRKQIVVALRRGSDQGLYFLSAGRAQVPRRLRTGVAGDHGFAPAWSPDGETIAFSAIQDGNVDVYLVRHDGTGLRRLTNDSAIDVSPAWSPDGKHVVYVSDRTGSPHLFTMTETGDEQSQITSEGSCEMPAWSSQDEIAYVSKSKGGSGIKIIAGKEIRSLQNAENGTMPTFSPDGNRVAFIADRSGRGQIVVVGRMGGELKQIPVAGVHSYPAWAQ